MSTPRLARPVAFEFFPKPSARRAPITHRDASSRRRVVARRRAIARARSTNSFARTVFGLNARRLACVGAETVNIVARVCGRRRRQARARSVGRILGHRNSTNLAPSIDRSRGNRSIEVNHSDARTDRRHGGGDRVRRAAARGRRVARGSRSQDGARDRGGRRRE